MHSTLQNLPDAVEECIVELLSLEDICNLRLASKIISEKSSPYHFRTYFRTQRVDLNLESLHDLVQNLDVGGLRSSVTNLCFTGIVYEADIEEEKRGDFATQNILNDPEVTLLTQVFNKLATSCKSRTLMSLTTRIIAIQKNGERVLPINFDRFHLGVKRSIWKCTAKTLNTVVCALAASKLHIGSLNIFDDQDMQQASIACDQLKTIIWDLPGLPEALSDLNSLSIRLSGHIFDFREDFIGWKRKQKKDPIRERAEAEDERNFLGLPNLLSLCQNLKSLQITYARVRRSIFEDALILQHVVRDSTKLPILNSCKLRGILAREEDLLDFIKRTKVSELSLECVGLRSGSFKPIFDYCTSADAEIKKLYFDSLYDSNGRTVYSDVDQVKADMEEHSPQDFDVVKREESKQPPWSYDVMKREGDNVLYPITYPVPDPMIPGNPWTAQRRAFQEAEYSI